MKEGRQHHSYDHGIIRTP